MWFYFYAVNNRPLHICAIHKTNKWNMYRCSESHYVFNYDNLVWHTLNTTMPPHLTPNKNCARCFTCRIRMATLWSACAAVCRVKRWFADDVLRSVEGEFLPKSDWSCKIDNICWMEWYPSITKTLCDPRLPAQGLSAMLVLPGKGSCRVQKLARELARCHCKKWVPGRLIGPGVRSFRLNILQQNPIFVMNCEKWWVLNHKIPMICQFQMYI